MGIFGDDVDAEAEASDIEAVFNLVNSDPVAGYGCNPIQKRFYDAIKDPRPNSITIIPFLKPNGAGGTFGLISAWSAIMFGTENPNLQGVPFGPEAWPFIKSARVVSTADALTDEGIIQKTIKRLFPMGRYHQTRGGGKHYYAQATTDTGWDWDVMTFDQSTEQAAGDNKGLIIISEPPPRDMFTECITRLRGAGIVLLDMTQLDKADWIEDMIDDGGLILDGRKVGDIRVVRGDIEEACIDHHPPRQDDLFAPCGTRMHSAIEADIASWPIEEREARRTGKPLRRSGRIFANWGEANELEKLSDWHQKEWDKGHVRVSNVVNPHDRPPWPIGWAATFRNNDVVWFGEWPPFAWHESKSSPISHYEDYRSLILEAEAEMPEIDNRVMDPLFGEAIKQTGFNLFTIMAAKCIKCQNAVKDTRFRGYDTAFKAQAERQDGSCPHSLHYRHGVAYPGSVNAGHILMRAAIGDPTNGIRPKLYVLKKFCPNICYALRHYAYHEHKEKTKGMSEKPQYVNKEVTDIVRLFYLSGLDKYPGEAPEPLDLYRPRQWPANKRTDQRAERNRA